MQEYYNAPAPDLPVRWLYSVRDLLPSVNSLLSETHLLNINNILFNPQVLDNEILTVRGILPHKEFKKSIYRVIFFHSYGFKSHILTDKMLELIRRYLSQSFKPCYLRIRSKLGNSFLSL